MATVKTLAIAAILVGSVSLALAQNGPVTPGSGPSPAPATTSDTGKAAQSVHKKKSHKLYNMQTSGQSVQKKKSHKLYNTTKPMKKKHPSVSK